MSDYQAEALPSQYRPVGITLAVVSGLLIGSSFPVKKAGLLRAHAKSGEAVLGEGVAYLKNPIWWTGMILMIVGEICNFGAYAFVEAIVVTPLGALSVVVSAVLSSFFLGEKLTTLGWLGCVQAILGSIIVALNGPKEESVATIAAFKTIFLAPWFLAYGSVVIVGCIIVIIWVAPKYGDKNMFVYIAVCSLIGGLSVSCIQGLGACIITSIRGDNQFTNWFIYILLAFVIITLLTELYYLNKALALFNTSFVTPVYFTMFTFCVLCTSVILYQGLHASAIEILTVVIGFLIICSGITLLQLSKVDPRKLGPKIDRRTTILLEAARQEVVLPEDVDPEKAELERTEEPGIDAMRGTFGAIGSIVRARRRATILSDAASHRGTIHSQNNHQESPGKSTIPLRARASAGTMTSYPRMSAQPEEEPTISYLLANDGTIVPAPAESSAAPAGQNVIRLFPGSPGKDHLFTASPEPAPSDMARSPSVKFVMSTPELTRKNLAPSPILLATGGSPHTNRTQPPRSHSAPSNIPKLSLDPDPPQVPVKVTESPPAVADGTENGKELAKEADESPRKEDEAKKEEEVESDVEHW